MWWINAKQLFGGNQIMYGFKTHIWHAFVIQSPPRQSFVYSSCNYSLVTVHGFYKTRFVHFYSALQSYSSSARKDGECLGKLSFKFGHQFFGLDFNQNCDLAILKYAFAWI